MDPILAADPLVQVDHVRSTPSQRKWAQRAGSVVARGLRCTGAMKQAIGLAVTVLALGACKFDMNKNLLGRGGDRGASGVGGGEAEHGEPAIVATPQAPAAQSDLCNDESRIAEADKITLCTVIAIEPAAGVAKVGPRKPGWCSKVPQAELEGSGLSYSQRWMLSMAEGGDWWEETPDAAAVLCMSPDDPAVQEQAGYLYQVWANLTGLPPEQIDGLLTELVPNFGRDYEAAMKEACNKAPSFDEGTSERDLAFAEGKRESIGCGNPSYLPYWVDLGTYPDLTWWMDEGEDVPSELLRSAVVRNCLPDRKELGVQEIAHYAVCGLDGRALDTQALEQEIAALPALLKAHARMQHGAVKRLVARYETEALARAKDDPAWQTLLFDAPAKGWASWAGMYALNKQAIDDALAYERLYDEPGRPRAKGCFKDAFKSFQNHATSAKPKTREDVIRGMTDEAGAIVLGRLVACTDAEQDIGARNFYQTLLGHAAEARGPRWAAYAAVMRAFGEIKTANPAFPAEPGYFNVRDDSGPFVGGGGGDLAKLDPTNDLGGVVKKLHKLDGGYRIEFKTDRWKERQWDCVSTGVLRGFYADGTPYYEQNCKDRGMEWVESKHEEVWIRAELAGGIAPGTFLISASTTADRHGDAWDSLPFEVWKDKEREKLVAFYGVEL